METHTHIYALTCPDTDQVRYVGKSNNPSKRLYSHLTDGRLNHRHNWLMSLKLNGKLPKVEILDTVKIEEWPFWERHYISLYKSFGFNLLNRTDGGEGSTYHNQKTRRSFSGENNPMFGKKRPDVSERLRKKLKGKTFDEIYGKEKSITIRKKISESGKKPKSFSEQGIINISNANKNKIISEETRLKMKKNSFWKGKKGCLHSGAKSVIQYDLDGNFIKEWPSISDADRFFGGHGIKQCLSKGTNKSHGFKWNYK